MWKCVPTDKNFGSLINWNVSKYSKNWSIFRLVALSIWNFYYKGCPKITESSLRMAKLTIVAYSSAKEPDLWSILRRWSEFHLAITLHRHLIFVKVVFVTPRTFKLSKTDLKNEEKSEIKFCRRLKKSAAKCKVNAQSVHWRGTAWRFNNLPLA